MYISRIELKNWRNFESVDVSLSERTFIIGPNASGKSNFLDVFRFMRDIVKKGGGIQSAIEARGGMTKLRYLNARKHPEVEIALEVSDFESSNACASESFERSHPCKWKYLVSIRQNSRGKHETYVNAEKIWHNGELLIERPNQADKEDPALLTQTWLEQISQNTQFRELANLFTEIQYFHLVPQLLRFPSAFTGPDLPNDPFGRGFLNLIANTSGKTRESRLKLINSMLIKAVPQLKDLKFEKDDGGHPHLTALFEHWRPHAGKQNELDFSDGTLRLIALLWTILSEKGVVLFEEPELSLHKEIVKQLPLLFYKATKSKRAKKQFIVTSHSEHLLDDKSISLSEVLLFTPGKTGTLCSRVSDDQNSQILFESGLSPAEIAFPQTKPSEIDDFTQAILPGF